MSYRDLEIWQMSRELVVDVHRMTMTQLPKFEMYEEGSQIRRSMKSVKSNIVEGYGRRRYKQEYIRFLIYSHSSCDETKDHLETLFETESLKNEDLYHDLHTRLEKLSKALSGFIKAVERQHMSVREEGAGYGAQDTGYNAV